MLAFMFLATSLPFIVDLHGSGTRDSLVALLQAVSRELMRRELVP